MSVGLAIRSARYLPYRCWRCGPSMLRTMAWRSRWQLLLVSAAGLSLGVILHFAVVYLHGECRQYRR
jgi:hypothetical protein